MDEGLKTSKKTLGNIKVQVQIEDFHSTFLILLR